MLSDAFKISLGKAFLQSPLFTDDFLHLDLSQLPLIKRNRFLNLKEEKQGFYHDEKNPHLEAKKQWEEILKENKQVVICYGIGLGYLYDQAKAWLKENQERRLIFFEKDKRVIARFFETKRGRTFSEDERVRLYVYRTKSPFLPASFYEEHLASIAAHIGSKSWTLTALPFYLKHHTKEVEEFFKLYKRVCFRNNIFDIHRRAGVHKILINKFHNLLLPLAHHEASSLRNRLKDIPAIICGAGSSILKHMDKLKMVQDRALIFAGGTSVSILNNHQLSLHISGIVDPDPNQFNFRLQTAFEVPCFYKLRSGSDVMLRNHGIRLLTSDTSEGYIDHWLRERFPLPERDENPTFWTVTDFLVEQACYLGCNPIILIGVDLSFEEDRYYADENLSGNELNFSMEERDNIYGEKVKTKLDWIYSSERISALLEVFPNTCFINATEGGIGFEGVPNTTFQECIEKHLKNRLDPERMAQACFLNISPTYHDKEKVYHTLLELEESLQKCTKIIEKLRSSLAILYINWQIKTLDEINPYEGIFKDLQEELEKEVVFKHFLAPMWRIQRRTLQQNLDDLRKYRLTLFGMRSREFDYYLLQAKTLEAIIARHIAYYRDTYKDPALSEETLL